MKLANSKEKEKILKAARDKRSLTYVERSIRLPADLSTDTWQIIKDWQDIFRVLKEKILKAARDKRSLTFMGDVLG